MSSINSSAESIVNPNEYIRVYKFMVSDLHLSGVPLLVYSRVFSFCSSGHFYYESKLRCATWLGVSRRSVVTAFNDLENRCYIEQIGEEILDVSSTAKVYQITLDPLKNAGIRLSEFNFLNFNHAEMNDGSPVSHLLDCENIAHENYDVCEAISQLGSTECETISQGMDISGEKSSPLSDVMVMQPHMTNELISDCYEHSSQHRVKNVHPILKINNKEYKNRR